MLQRTKLYIIACGGKTEETPNYPCLLVLTVLCKTIPLNQYCDLLLTNNKGAKVTGCHSHGCIIEHCKVCLANLLSLILALMM